MARLPACLTLVEDELFTSWMGANAELNGCITREEKQRFYDFFFGGSIVTKLNYPANLQDMCQEKDTSFPDMFTILKRHTNMYALLPFTTIGIQGKEMEYCLRKQKRPGASTTGRVRIGEKKICPVCLKEDMQTYGRKIIHVQHLLETTTCWKHNTKLKDANNLKLDDLEIEYGTEQEKQMAAFMHDSYENPVYISLEQTHSIFQKVIKERHLTVKQVCEELVKNGYLIKDDIPVEPTVMIYRKRKIVLALLTWLFVTYANFCKVIPESNVFDENVNDDFELLEKIDILGKYKCKTCGHVFYMHPTAVKRGTPCPKCNLHMTEGEVFDRYLERYFNGEYELIVDKTQYKMRHKVCETMHNVNPSSVFWKDVRYCSVCDSRTIRWQRRIDPTGKTYKVVISGNNLKITHIPYNHSFTLCTGSQMIKTRKVSCRICDTRTRINEMKKLREGEVNIDNSGRKRKLICYRRSDDIDVQYVNDPTIYRMTYRAFKNGRVQLPNHVREKKPNRQGMELEIVGYRSLLDLDVRFPDGTVVKSTYEMFKRGTITKEERVSVREQRIGMTTLNHWGERLTIVEYRNYKDIDVAFDDGTVVTTSYVRFKTPRNKIRKDGK